MAIRRTAPLLLAFGLCAQAGAAVPARPVVDDQVRVTLPGTVHRRLARLAPVRAVDPDFAMDRMLLVLKMPPAAKADLDGLLKDQQNPASPRYHQWLTPEAFGQRFGPGQAQVDAASLWLLQQGFSIDKTSKSGLIIAFSGTAAQVGKAFRTAMVEYQVDGATHRGNATDISIPQGLAGFVHGVASLNDLKPHAAPIPVRTAAKTRGGKAQGLDGYGYTYIGPSDFATIYHLTPLFTAASPIDGTGVSIGIVGESDILASDFTAFRNAFSLTQPGGQLTFVYSTYYNATAVDPGFPDPGDQSESSLDTEWASATAPGAAIKLVISPSSATTGGVDLSAEYLVDTNLTPIISYSYGACEADMGSSYSTMYEQLWAQAAGQGISVFVSSGDSGAAGCDDPDAFEAAKGKGVSGFSSTPYNTSVGGTMFSSASSTYWDTANGTPLGYVPEQAWNECAILGEYYGGGSRILGGGGGASMYWSKPSWQVAPGVSGAMREVPDVAFNAAVFTDPTAVYIGGQMQEYGGTSVATPCMAGIMALVVQKAGGVRQGLANPTLYSLANAQYSGANGAATIFHDITSGDNSVPNLTGFAAGPGYDQATGLGSLDATALVQNWVPGANPITVTAGAPIGTLTSGSTLVFTGSATDTAANPSLTYEWSFGDGGTKAGASTTYSYYLNGPQSQTFQAHLTATDQYGNTQTSASIAVPITYQGVTVSIATPVTSAIVMPTENGIVNPITFTAGPASTLTPGGSGLSYEWDIFNPDTEANVQSTTGPTTSFAFPGTSSYGWPVQLTVTDGFGNQGQAWIYVYANLNDALDQNGDGVVDVRDLLAMASSWGNVQATASNFNGLYILADLNADGVVNDADLTLWLDNFTPAAP